MRLKRLLYMSEHPPSHLGGGPLIARQHLRRYDQSALRVLCDDRICRDVRGSHSDALLPCPHRTVPNLERITLRPRRVFGSVFDAVNLGRLPLIRRAGRQIIDANGIEAILTIPWRAEFALAAYQLSRERNLPLYIFETDDWHAANQGPVVGRVTRRWHEPILASAEQLWVTSPQMARLYRGRFGVESEFLFHFVDPDLYAQAQPREAPDPAELRMVYTGAVNSMFLDALERIAQWLNEGIRIGGRRLVLDLWGGRCPEHLRGPGVRWRGFVPSEEIPAILAGAEVLLIAVSFSDEPALRDLVRTSLYTKTIDYLAAGKPVVVVSPADTAEVDYFSSVIWLADALERRVFEQVVQHATDPDQSRSKIEAGLRLVRSHHTPETMGDRFLSHFRAREVVPA